MWSPVSAGRSLKNSVQCLLPVFSVLICSVVIGADEDGGTASENIRADLVF